MFLVYIFLGFAIYGFVVGKIGGALLSFVMAVVCLLGARKLNKRDAEFEAAQEKKKTEAVDDLES